jgi:tRNA(Ile)-lysidine synthase
LTVQVAVAVSGGADSIALLLEAVRRFPPGEVVALAVDHRTRGAAADERAYVARVAVRLGCRYEQLQIDAARRHHAAWRTERLRVFLRLCGSRGIGRLWLGHHADDAIETAAMRLLADGPLTAVAGIAAARSACGVSIERPLLHLSARSIRRSLMAAGIGWCEDPSNRDARHTRVALRRVVRDMDRVVPDVLVRRIGRWRAERSLLMCEAWQLAAEWLPTGAVAICPRAYRALPGVLAQEVLREAALLAAGRAQRLRQANFAATADFEPPWQLGGVRVVPDGDRWLVHRDARHIREVVRISGSTAVQWDARFDLSTSKPPTGDDWHIARAGAIGARMTGKAASAGPVEALPALWHGSELVAMPTLGIWRGPYGEYWATRLLCGAHQRGPIDYFRVAP